MSIAFQYVEVPKELRKIIGVSDKGTRLYRKDGTDEECGHWFEALTDLIGPSVSPGGVAMYCPVSRAAVYKRIKEGRLSAFCYHVTSEAVSLFGKKRILRDSPYIYVPVSEAREWKKELEAEAVRRGRVTQEELEGAKPDWRGEFFEWQNKRERYREKEESFFKGLSLADRARLLTYLARGKSFSIRYDKSGKGKLHEGDNFRIGREPGDEE